MFFKAPKESTDPRVRSLLQKAARRGFGHVVERTIVHLEHSGDQAWLRSRAIVITFEECWPLAVSLAITSGPSSKRSALSSVSKAAKQKDAAGLGALAHAYHEGDRSMLDCVPDPDLLEVVSEGLGRPPQFFDWLREKAKSEASRDVIGAAQQYLPAASWPWDKACILGAALLSTAGEVPEVEPAEVEKEEFPYWVALDKHTPQGKVVLNETARQVDASYRQLIWASFYCESAVVNRLLPSPWWEAEKTWRLRRAGLTVASAQTLWSRASGLIRDHLSSEAAALQALIDNIDSAGSEEFPEAHRAGPRLSTP